VTEASEIISTETTVFLGFFRVQTETESYQIFLLVGKVCLLERLTGKAFFQVCLEKRIISEL